VDWIVHAVGAGGIRIVEITLDSADAFGRIQQLRR
jgi:2-keto-3-deoxy-6-phosphogluconate aldolase